MGILNLKKANCKNCYKCIRVCPVKSIEFAEEQAKIISNECILCGRCVVYCPQNAKECRNDVGVVKKAIAEGKRVVASVAPSFISDFAVKDIQEFTQMLRRLGFDASGETAEGAYIVKSEYERILENHEQDVVISSCCHTVTKLIQKYYPLALRNLAHVISPMQAHAATLKEADPDAFVVFIGPCISKKDEAEKYGDVVDCVLTFEELREWLEEEGISCDNPSQTEVKIDSDGGRRSRFFPETGGIIKSMKTTGSDYRYIAVDGVEKCIAVLKEIVAGRLQHCFVEMSACEGSCIGGPAARRYTDNVIDCQLRIEEYALPPWEKFPRLTDDLPDFQASADWELTKPMESEYIDEHIPSEKIIKEILAKMGKTKPEQELNCGTCGYDTCREKAIAVYKGKANLTMCLPYMKEKAESFSDNIIMMTPNGIMVLDEDLRIQQINHAACKIFNISNPSTLHDTPVIEIMDPTIFVNTLMTGKAVEDKNKYLPEYNKYVEISVVFDQEQRILICILRDITAREVENERLKNLREKTVEVTDKVVQKQMRVVQEIASLLGETTAETKIALTKLKETLNSEDN